jgi:hypothetical protein
MYEVGFGDTIAGRIDKGKGKLGAVGRETILSF